MKMVNAGEPYKKEEIVEIREEGSRACMATSVQFTCQMFKVVTKHWTCRLVIVSCTTLNGNDKRIEGVWSFDLICLHLCLRKKVTVSHVIHMAVACTDM